MHIFYINDAIEESQSESKILTKRSMNLEFEPPALTICPKPAFKPSISTLFNLSMPLRSIFLGDPWYQSKNTSNVQELFEKFSYANDLTFLYVSRLNRYVSFKFIKIPKSSCQYIINSSAYSISQIREQMSGPEIS